jgi:MtrB/PioB family decaheme-associated outer membrane protein
LFGNTNNNQVAGRAAFALPPSNSEHEINGAVSYDLTDRTRVNADVAYSMQMQDATMPATTLDPLSAFAASDAASILSNPSHIDGTVQNFYGNVSVVSHPLSKLNLKASYTVDDRKDDTSASSFFRPIQDSPTEGTEADAISRMSFNDQKANLEASYNVLSRTKVTVGYTFQQKNESFGQFSGTRENAVTGKVRSSLMDDLDGSLAYTHSNRYGMGTWVSSRDPNAVQATGTYVYYEAPRAHDEIKGILSFVPHNEFALGLNTKLAQDHYNDVAHAAAPYNVDAPGLRNDHNVNIGPDLAFTPNKALSTHLFYNYQKVFYDNRILDPIAGLLGSSNLAHYGTTDETHTVGAGATWQAAPKLKFGANYSFAYGNTAINVTDGATAAYIASTASASTYAVQPLPDATSQLHTISLHGEYQFQPNMSLWAGYSFERLLYTDWAYDSGTSGAIFGNALLPGDQNPSYAVHTVGVALRVKW